MTDKTVERANLMMPDKYCLYQGMRNPSNHSEVSWMQYEAYATKIQAAAAMRAKHASHGGLWLVIKETPIMGMLPEEVPV